MTIKNNIGTLITIAAISLSACTEDQWTEPGQTTEKKIFYFDTEINPQTRTTFNKEFNGLEWTASDMLGFYSNAGDMNKPSSLVNENGCFHVELSNKATEVYAYYPYYGSLRYNDILNAETKECAPNEIRLPISAIQRQKEAGKLNGENLPMLAKATLSTQGTATLTFSPLASIIAFNVFGENGENVETISFTNEAGVCGDYIYNTIKQKYELLGTRPTVNTASICLDTPYEIPSTKPEDKSGYIYLTIKTGTYSRQSSIKVTTDKAIYTFTLETLNMSNKYLIQPIALDLQKAKKEEITYIDNKFNEDFIFSLRRDFDLNKDGKLSSSEADAIEGIEFLYHQNRSLKGIESLRNLRWFIYTGSVLQLQELDVSQNSNLIFLTAKNCQLEKLTLGNNPNLSFLHCDHNNLTTLDLSGCTNLHWLCAQYNKLKTINLGKLSELQHIQLENNLLTSLSIENQPMLTFLNAYDNLLKSIMIQKCNNLKMINISDNQLVSLDVCECSNKMDYVNCARQYKNNNETVDSFRLIKNKNQTITQYYLPDIKDAQVVEK